MPTRLSSILGVTREELEKKGVYDSMIDYDSRLHIDPALLKKCKTPEFSGADQKVAKYFNEVLRLLRLAKNKSDALWRAALKKLTFGEGLNLGLGYSTVRRGSGIGPDIALQIAETVKDIVDAGTVDPAIFDLVPLFEARVGPDRISDMVSIILKEEFFSFTKRIANELGKDIPVDLKGKQMVFVPKAMLSDLFIAEQWDDVQVAAAYNESVRQTLNDIIGKSWKKMASDITKQELKELLLQNPELLKELLTKYKSRLGDGYDFILDHMGIMIWDILGPKIAQDYPLDLTKYQVVTSENVLEIVNAICKQFAKLIESNGLVDHLYDSNGDRRIEKFPQLLFYAIADSYCTANSLDLNREVNAGSGALDFKVSHGKAKVTVEIKYSSNPKLVEGFTKQLPAYNKAEGVEEKYSIYLVLKVNNNQKFKIAEINAIVQERSSQGQKSPSFMVIDAIKLPSASKR